MRFKIIRLSLTALVMLALSACDLGKPSFDGTWSTNIAKLTLDQKGEQVTGLMEGYGDNWRQEISGTAKGNMLTLTSQNPLNLSTIVLDEGGDTFHTADAGLAFCGSKSNVLPDGCGFSGKWNFNAPDLFPSGSYAVLKQNGPSVSGSIFDANGATLMRVDAEVEWGKGWAATWQGYRATMTSDEKAFQITLDTAPGSNQWCGLRDGESSAYVFFFTCTLP